MSTMSVPPQNLEAEMAVLGAGLLDSGILQRIAQLVEPRDFYLASHGLIFKTMADLASAGNPVDRMSVADELKRRKTLEKVGGFGYLTQLLDTVPTLASALYYAEIVREASDARDIVRASRAAAERAFSGATVGEIVGSLEERLREIKSRRARSEAVTILDAANAAIARHEAGIEKGMSWGIQSLDEMTRGIKTKQVVVIAATTGTGKSAFAEHIAHRVSWSKRVLYIPAEMGRDETASRIAARAADTSLANLGHLEPAQRERMEKALASRDLLIEDYDTPVTLARISAAVSVHKPDLVVIDHARHINGWHDGQTRDRAPTAILYALKDMAAQQGTAMVLATQVNRDGAKRGRLELTDLRDTGAFEEIAHKVVLLYRPRRGLPTDNVMEYKVAKNREGPEGLLYSWWMPSIMAVRDMAPDDQMKIRAEVE